MLYLLKPEVAGGFGSNTIIDENNNVVHLEYEFFGWLGDELLETTPCYIISDSLQSEIQKSNLSGFELQQIEISINEQFYDVYPNADIPPFHMRLIPTGHVNVDRNNARYTNWSGEDFCFSDTRYLIVTERALNILKKHKMNYCEIMEVKEE